MTYRLRFKTQAWKEWGNLNSTIREQLKKKLAERVEHPRVDSARLSGMVDCYKIKPRHAGYCLVYQARDDELVVSVIVTGKRERNQIYKTAIKRI